MPASHNGLVKFIGYDNSEALVEQTLLTSSFVDGFRLVKADFSAKVVGNTINYSYNGGYGDTDAITIF